MRAEAPGEEPTAFQHPVPKPGGAAARNTKMGGSAAEYSQMMQRPDLAGVLDDGESDPTVAGADAIPDSKLKGGAKASAKAKAAKAKAEAPPPEPPPPAAIPGDAAATGSRVRELPKAPSVQMSAVSVPPDPANGAVEPDKAADRDKRKAKRARLASAPSQDLPSFKKAPSDGSADASDRSSPPSPDKSADKKKVGPVGTRMVDDALWVLFGKKGKVEQVPTDDDADEPAASDRKEPVRARLRRPGEPAAPRVVRTGERFGTWAQVATMTVLSVAGAFAGHWVMLSSAGPGPEVASEEVKGLASDLERGGLAALLSAEERAADLARSAPKLEPLLDGVKAEIYARRWRSFGREREMRAKAQEAADGLKGRRPTVELVAGLVALSTSAAQRKPLHSELRRLAQSYGESPKIRVLQAKLHLAAGQDRAALTSLHEARAIHPHHRATLLELARWYRRSGAHAESLATYASLQERYPLDVEAAIERYVLGQVTGADPDEAQAVSILAGLVRNEDPAVAKDETGRASLAFALPLLARGELVEGIEELAKAESAFSRSAVFKYAVGGAYLAVGELDRAEAMFEASSKLEPSARAPKLGLARVRYAREAGIKVDLTREAERIAKRFKAMPADRRQGVARLPLGMLKFDPERFELIRFRPDPAIFPEDRYRATKDAADFPSVNLIALGERDLDSGDVEGAAKRFEAALGHRPTAEARFGLGRALMAKGEESAAIRMLRAGVEQAPDDISGRLTLARALMARGQRAEALEALEPLDRSTVVAPDGLLWLGRLRVERGDYEGAVGPLRTVTELRPNDVDARLAYGEVLHHLRLADDAQAVFGDAARMDKRVSRREDLSPVALMYLGRVELERSRRRGVALLRKALKHERVPAEAHYYLGTALTKSRRTRSQGRRELRRYVRIGPPGELRDRASRLLRRR